MAAGVVSLALGAVPGRADAADADRLLSLTNQVRSAQGLSPLTLDGELSSVAQTWATTLAVRGTISHNPLLASQVTGWNLLGENVGVAGTVDAVHDAFVGSPTHYQNLVHPSFTRVGFGIVRLAGPVFVVEVFVRPASAPAPVPAPAAAPAVGASPPATAARPAAAPATTVPAAKPSGAPTPVPGVEPDVASAATAQSTPGQLSPWMVHSLDQLRSMERPTVT